MPLRTLLSNASRILVAVPAALLLASCATAPGRPSAPASGNLARFSAEQAFDTLLRRQDQVLLATLGAKSAIGRRRASPHSTSARA